MEKSAKVKTSLNPEKWVSLYYDYFYNYTKSRVADSYAVEELIQETFFSGLKSMKNYKNNASERTWLISILKHKIIDHYRKCNTIKGTIEKRMISKEDYKEIYHKELSDEVYFDNEVQDPVYYSELRKKVIMNLKKLPKNQADVFTMRVLNGFETETICEKLNITKDNVWVLMWRARKNLSTSLAGSLP